MISGIPNLAGLQASSAAVQGRKKAVEAGMNGYLVKPVDVRLLHAELLRFLAGEMPLLPERPSEPSAGGPLDAGKAIRALGGNVRLYARLADRFETEWYNAADRLERLLAADPTQAARLVHSLKGVVASLGGVGLAKEADRIEHLIRDGNLHAACDALPFLKSSMQDFLAALDALAACRTFPSLSA